MITSRNLAVMHVEGSPACPFSVRAICSLDARVASVADRELLARVSFLSFTGSPTVALPGDVLASRLVP